MQAPVAPWQPPNPSKPASMLPSGIMEHHLPANPEEAAVEAVVEVEEGDTPLSTTTMSETDSPLPSHRVQVLVAKRADSLALREAKPSSTVTIPLVNSIRSLAITLPLRINELPKDEATLKAFNDLIAALHVKFLEL